MSVFGKIIDPLRPRTLHAETQGHIEALANTERHPRERYRLLEAYYHAGDLYDELRHGLLMLDVPAEQVKNLRNPAHAIVEFYAATLFPGANPHNAIPIETEIDGLREAIHLVWEWSNMAANKQVLARWFAMYGDVFVKIATRSDEATGEVRRVFQQPIRPEHVTEFEVDERGFFTYVRLDIPKVRRDGDEFVSYWHTEVWDKPNDSFRVWERDARFGQTIDTPINQLGTPVRDEPITDFGFDFIPLVHGKFQDIGDDRGQSALLSGIAMIDEANRMATRLHRMLFRHGEPVWALEANMVDTDGLPLPPPLINGPDGEIIPGNNEPTEVSLGGDTMVNLPGMSKLVPLIPDVNYQAHLDALNAHLERMTAYHYPELRYYEISDRDLSGRAIAFLLIGATDRVREARGNIERALVRANEMALTIATIHDLPGFEKLTKGWEQGGFQHSIGERDILPVSEVDAAEIAYRRAQTQSLKAGYGYPHAELWREDGKSEEEIAQMLIDAEQERLNLGEQLLRQFDRQ